MKPTAQQLKDLREAIDAALEPVVKQFGLQTLKAGRCTYTHHGAVTYKLEGLFAGGVSPEAERYDIAAKYDAKELPPRGSAFTPNGNIFTITGMAKGGRVITERGDGKSYVWQRNAVITLFKAFPVQ